MRKQLRYENAIWSDRIRLTGRGQSDMLSDDNPTTESEHPK